MCTSRKEKFISSNSFIFYSEKKVFYVLVSVIKEILRIEVNKIDKSLNVYRDKNRCEFSV